MGFHASVAGHFAKKITFTKTGRMCGSAGQSMMLSACITDFLSGG